MGFLDGWPYPLTVVTLFVIVMLRANGTYWLGRALNRGARATRAQRLVASPGFARAERMIDRWGAPVVSLSFLTVGFQTLMNLAAGVVRMPLRRYLPAVVIGSVIWALLYATVGFVAFGAVARVWELSPAAAIVVVSVAVAGIAAFIGWNVRRRSHETGDDDERDDRTGRVAARD